MGCTFCHRWRWWAYLHGYMPEHKCFYDSLASSDKDAPDA